MHFQVSIIDVDLIPHLDWRVDTIKKKLMNASKREKKSGKNKRVDRERKRINKIQDLSDNFKFKVFFYITNL